MVRPHSLMPEKKSRAWYKCSECRRRRQKCTPKDRDWEHRKCDFCNTHNLVCGKNYKKDEDPAVERLADVGSSEGEGVPNENGGDNEIAQGAEPGASTHDAPIRDINRISRYTQGPGESSSQGADHLDDHHARIVALSDGQLRAQALSKLEKLTILGAASIYESRLVPISCKCLGAPEEYEEMARETSCLILEEMHTIFIHIYELAFEADSRARDAEAREFFLKLLLALERYPRLCDDRKRGALLKVALFFQRSEDQCEYECILEKVADLQEKSKLPLHENACPLLAASFEKTSDKARNLLASLWKGRFGVTVPSDLAMPPLQRAIQRRSIGVASAVLSKPNGFSPAPGMLGQHALHLAAASGSLQNLYQILQAGVSVDMRDLHQRTALFLAAASGHYQCSVTLLMNGARVEKRDAHGHSILEAAARGGFLAVAELLVLWGASVNPVLSKCASTPLQAATESRNFSLDLVQYLIGLDTDIGIPRLFDGRNAIDLAEEKGLTVLAESLRGKRKEQEDLLAQPPTAPYGYDPYSPFQFGGSQFAVGFT